MGAADFKSPFPHSPCGFPASSLNCLLRSTSRQLRSLTTVTSASMNSHAVPEYLRFYRGVVQKYGAHLSKTAEFPRIGPEIGRGILCYQLHKVVCNLAEVLNMAVRIICEHVVFFDAFCATDNAS